MSFKVVALCGGVGGAKLVLGLAQVVPAEDLTIIVNTGDDFQHLGLHISPDVDTVLYTLAGISDPDRGWGLANESWSFMRAVARLHGDDWFRLGDGDLATHVLRTERLRSGHSLTQVTMELAKALSIGLAVLPVSNDAVRTVLDTDEGRLEFQDYFVRRQARPAVKSITYEGSERAQPSPEALRALSDPHLGLIVVCPSNPWLSIAPMLALPALYAAIRNSRRPVVAVSPLVGGMAVKGPTAKLMAELRHSISAQEVARFYGPLVSAHVVDTSHAHEAEALTADGFVVDVQPTLMTDAASKQRLAAAVVAFGRRLS